MIVRSQIRVRRSELFRPDDRAGKPKGGWGARFCEAVPFEGTLFQVSLMSWNPRIGKRSGHANG